MKYLIWIMVLCFCMGTEFINGLESILDKRLWFLIFNIIGLGICIFAITLNLNSLLKILKC